VNFLEHAAVELGGGLVDTGRIDEDDLRAWMAAFARGQFDDAGDAIARGLRLGRDDGDLFAGQRVEQRALPYIGTAENGNES
jgi:hypothetical protein